MKYFYLATLLIFTACVSLTYNNTSTSFPDQSELLQSDNDNISKVIIYNYSNEFLYSLGNADKISIYINHEGFTRLKNKQYIQLLLAKGKYLFEFEHRDVFFIRSKHINNITNKTHNFIIKYTMTGHDIFEVDKLPENFYNIFKFNIEPTINDKYLRGCYFPISL